MRHILLGPPGTGKTTTLIQLVQEELERGVAPDRIGYLAFTKKAATEATERACQRFSLQPKDFPFFRTIHSFCFRCVGVNRDQMIAPEHYTEFGKAMKIDVSGQFNLEEGGSFGFKQGDRMLFMSSLAKVKMIPLIDQYRIEPDDLRYDEVERVEKGFEAFKEANFLMDYNDLLVEFLKSGQPPRLEVLFIDEAQDLSKLQWQVVEKIASSVEKVFIAGDDDQAIFRWAGADVDYFITMRGDTVRTLEQSYRIPRSVQSLSDNILKGLKNRREKLWSPRDEQGSVNWHVSMENFNFKKEQEYLVLFRNAFLGKSLKDSLRQNGILYSYRGFSSIRQNLLEAVVFWQRLLKGQELSLEQVKKIYDLMTVNIGVKRGFKGLQNTQEDQKFKMDDLIQNHGLLTTRIWHEALDKINYYDKQYLIAVLRNGTKLTEKPRINLSTIHGAKGGEAGNVVLLSDMASRTYSDYLKNREDEHRVFYVAATRTKQNLHIIKPQTNKYFSLQY